VKPIRNILQSSYLGKLYQKDKTIFAFATLFIGLSVFANAIRLETSPFFLWNLYALKQSPKQEYTIYEIRYNKGELVNFQHTWRAPQQQFLTAPLFYYSDMKTNGGLDPLQIYLGGLWVKKHPLFKSLVPRLTNSQSDYDAFPQWYKFYLSSIEKRPVKNVYVLKKRLNFIENGNITEISADSVLSIR
jgi:hypothetical protein